MAGGVDDGRTDCVALVPLARPLLRVASCMSRPDSTFVAHLIATAAQAPQTRTLRRAAPSDAQIAYTAHLRPASGAGCRTRQVV